MSKRIIVISYEGKDYVLINPILKQRSDELVDSEEMCLSFIGIQPVKVKRHKSIIVDAFDEKGEKMTYQLSGMLGYIFQHEMEHLDGTLLIDHLSNLRKTMVKKRIEKLHKKAVKRMKMFTR